MNTQFSVFLDNRVGKLRELVQTFDAPSAIELVSLSVIDSTGHAVVRVLTSRAELARRLLDRAELPYSEADVLVVELNDATDFGRACQALLSAEVSIHYAYPLLITRRNRPAMAIYTDDNILAGQIMRRKMFTLLAENDLGENATPGDSGAFGAL